ncbi:MAG: NADH:flavin oxidoreductase [Desulfobacterales bacterium]|jgi:2,4-dienoyl-CoA reductase-like NADH-dependent reductase (Old Yellow Enzyme family)
MTTLFEESAVNGMTISNRLVRSATWEGMCDPDGRPTPRLIDCYRELAEGGVGLIISGYTYVRPDGKQSPGKMGIHRDDFEGDYTRLIDSVHAAGGRLAIQLVHAGGQTTTAVAGRQPLAPSAVKTDQFPETPAELTRDGIEAIVAAFAQGARRGKAWGADGVQLHGAHGYLINQFLSPLTNRRTDPYGGDIDNRCRFLMEVYGAVRSEVGSGYPVMIKLNASDNLEGGLGLDGALAAARKLSEAGIDAIEVSAGTPASGASSPARQKIDRPEKEGYHLDLARRIKATAACPVMVVGGFRSYDVAEQAVATNGMDYIALSRPLIREPDLPNRWRRGDRSPARCISCNGCFKPALEEGGIACVVERKEREKASRR